MSNEMTERERNFFPAMADMLDREATSRQEPQQPDPAEGFYASMRREQPGQQNTSPQEPALDPAEARARAFFDKSYPKVEQEPEEKPTEQKPVTQEDAYASVTFDAAPEGATDEEREQYAALQTGAKEIFKDLSIAAPDAQEVVEVFREFGPTPPSAEQQESWQAESVNLLKHAYGSEAAQALADASALAKRDPRVLQALEAAGLGSHPKVIMQLAKAARAERARGRLT